MRYNPLVYLLVFVITSCKEEQVTTSSICNSLLYAACSGNDTTPYCTFGYKWGTQNPFPNAGAGRPGPSTGNVDISYKFQDADFLFDTHSQSDLRSGSFDKMIACSRQKVREAFFAWESVANVKFVEKSSQDMTDIKVVVAGIQQGGIAYPSLPNQACGGLVIINSNATYTCDSFYGLVLHEIGHALGLGHISSSNVMNPNKYYLSLQLGDVEGIQSIYGKK